MDSLLTQQQAKSLEEADFAYIFGDIHKFKTKPRLHQCASILWAMDRDCGLFLHDIGTGKTLSALYTIQVWKCRKVLVICPNSVRNTWMEQITEHTDESFTVLEGEAKARCALMEESRARYHIVNYEGLKCLFAKKVPVLKKDNKPSSKYVPDHEKILKMEYDCVVWDEAHHVGSSQTLQTDISYHLARFARKRLMLTGTPISRDIRDFFQEFKILDDGVCLGGSEFEFLHAYMTRVEIKTRTHKFFEWFPKKDAAKLVIEKIAPSTIRYDIAECCDLPELIMETRHVTMTAEQRDLLKAVVDKLKIEIASGKLNVKNILNFENIGNETIKLAQIGSGIVIEPEKTHVLDSNPKLDELIDIIESEVAGKVVVFHNFVEVGRQIEERLRKLKIKFRSIRGEIKDKMKQIDDFRKNPDIKVMVAHPLSGGEGLNFQCANVAIFVDWIGMGSIMRDQCIGRIHRMGQKQPCVVIDLLLADPGTGRETVDQRIHSSVSTKCDISKAMLEWIRDY